MKPYSIIHGDCLAVMRTMEPDSVDAIACDPPYGLVEPRSGTGNNRPTGTLYAPRSEETKKARRGGFMGKAWDSQTPGIEYWAEALRVAKPGAHLLAFGGTRTFHRLACAIEDAGWEIRDTLNWMYGSGFPKSLDVGKAIDRARNNGVGDIVKACAWIADRCDQLGVNRRRLDEMAGTSDMAGWWASRLSHRCLIPTLEQWQKIQPLLGEPPEWMVTLLLPARQPGEAWEKREVMGLHPNPATPRIGTFNASFGEAVISAPATDFAKQWDGWGTALKPGWEPIIMARKPLVGTVAANVTQWGTGAINVDGCRIGAEVRHNSPATPKHGTFNCSFAKDYQGQTVAGRWPANVALSHTPDCREVGTRKLKTGTVVRKNGGSQKVGGNGIYGAFNDAGQTEDTGFADADGTETVTAWECVPGCPVRMLDEQSGERGANGKSTGAQKGAGAIIRHGGTQIDAPFYADRGGPSRFFYTAKASRAEREMGLDGMPQKPSAKLAGGEFVNPMHGPGATSNKAARAANVHPTVKPLALMRWLCRLVTPPNGLILDPFCGSGSTGCAAALEGFRFVGIEQDAEYCAIAEKRIAHWAKAAAEQQPDLEPAA